MLHFRFGAGALDRKRFLNIIIFGSPEAPCLGLSRLKENSTVALVGDAVGETFKIKALAVAWETQPTLFALGVFALSSIRFPFAYFRDRVPVRNQPHFSNFQI